MAVTGESGPSDPKVQSGGSDAELVIWIICFWEGQRYSDWQ